MMIKISKGLQKNSFWISILLHVLIFLSFFSVLHGRQASIQPKPNLYIPSYVYHEELSRALNQSETANQKSVPISKEGIEKPVAQQPTLVKDLIKSDPQKKQLTKMTEAVHLVGNKKVDPKPLIKLLATALTKTLVYPKSAVDFRLKGTAYIRFLLHPNGQITDVQLIQSSSAGVLDQAALDSVFAISPLHGVEKYLFEAEYITFGFIFGP